MCSEIYPMNRIDAALLHELQLDSSLSIAELADRLGLSSSACHRRIRSLTDAGIIIGYQARVDRKRLGLSVESFVEITLTSQSRSAMEKFEEAVAGFDDILECHLMSGAADYLLRVAASDLEDFNSIHRNCLSRLPGVSSMRTSFSIRRIKSMGPYRVTVTQ
jgi:DNA-binding Lrp family transcriptional regulator